MKPRKVSHLRLVGAPPLPKPLPALDPPPLRCNGVGRDAEHPCFVSVAFSRPLTDDELRFFHDVCRRTGPLMADRNDDGA